SVAADQASVTVNEGQTASNTGTFGDPGLDTVALSASVGTITGANGAWSWSFATNDGPDQSQTVTITATDSDGAATTTTFSLLARTAAPSVAADHRSVTVNKGQPASSTGGFSDPGLETVALSASVGSVVAGANGAWSWSFATNDG